MLVLLNINVTIGLSQPLLDFLGSMSVLEVVEKDCFQSGTKRKVTLAFTPIVLFTIIIGWFSNECRVIVLSKT